jgi:hypothetical protein
MTMLVYLLFLGLCAAGVTAWRRAARLATRVTDYVLENRSRFGPAITDDPRTGAEAR